MDPVALLQLLVRRWRVVGPVLVLTGVLGVIAPSLNQPRYVSTGWLILDSPLLDAVDPAQTPIDPAELALGDEVAGATDGNAVVRFLGGNQYSVIATDLSQDGAVSAVEDVVDRLEDVIQRVQEQDGVPVAERLELRLVTPEVLAQPQPDGTSAASATVFLHDPAAISANPYPPVASTARLLEVAAMGDEGQQTFAAALGPGFDVAVSPDAREADTLLEVEVTGPSRAAATNAFDQARAVMAADLDRRQERAAVPPDERTTLQVLDAPLGAAIEAPPLKRALVGIVVLGGLLALGLAVSVDGLDRMSDDVRRWRTSPFRGRRHAPTRPSWDASGSRAGPSDPVEARTAPSARPPAVAGRRGSP